MNNLIPLHNIVDEKRGNVQEFFINFFEKCNLKCGFCWQDHDDITGMDDIPSKANTVINNASPVGYKYINVMGGELFADDIDDSIFQEYIEFATKLDAGIDNYEINFVTNLVFHNTARVIELIEKLTSSGINVNLVTSYDPVGRFNKSQLELFLRNLSIFGDMIRSISIVMTRQNIKYITDGLDSVFDDIYNGYSVYFDFYSPEQNTKIYKPSDIEVSNFFIYLLNNYPNAEPINQYINNTHNTTSCRASFIILPSGNTGSCRVLVDNGEFKSNTSNGFYEMEARFIEEKKCISCQYYKRCGLGCFLHNDHISHTVESECSFKIFHRALEVYEE